MECSAEGGHVHDQRGCASGSVREEEVECLFLRLENVVKE